MGSSKSHSFDARATIFCFRLHLKLQTSSQTLSQTSNFITNFKLHLKLQTSNFLIKNIINIIYEHCVYYNIITLLDIERVSKLYVLLKRSLFVSLLTGLMTNTSYNTCWSVSMGTMLLSASDVSIHSAVGARNISRRALRRSASWASHAVVISPAGLSARPVPPRLRRRSGVGRVPLNSSPAFSAVPCMAGKKLLGEWQVKKLFRVERCGFAQQTWSVESHCWR